MLDNFFYVLGWPQPSGKIAILCRSGGTEPGPAYCWSKRDAIQLRTQLANDRRTGGNPCALRIIQQLLVFKYLSRKPLPSRPGDLWAYSESSYLEPVEAVS